jgi:hypothetical protein
VVTTEVAFCNFCGRPRNLRNEQHQLGALVRTIVTCETCHRTLSSTIGVAIDTPEPEAATPEPAAPEPAPEPAAAATPPKAHAARPAAKPAAQRKLATTRSTASKGTKKSK